MAGVITVTLPDGSSKELPAGSTVGDLAAAVWPPSGQGRRRRGGRRP